MAASKALNSVGFTLKEYTFGGAKPVSVGLGHFEAVGFEEGGIGEELGGGAIGDDASFVEDDGAGEDFGDEPHVVGADEEGLFEGAKEADEFAAPAGVEAGGGLVEDEEVWGHGEDGGEGSAFALADGEVEGLSLFESGEADGVEGLGDAVVDFFFGEAHVDGAEGDVVVDGGAEELVVGVLEDEADEGADAAEVFARDG